MLSSKEEGTMKKNIRRFLALFMAFAMLAAYSFSPQNLTAFAVSAAEEPTVAAQEAEKTTETTQPTTEETQAETQAAPAEKPAEQETEAVTEEGGEQSEPTEATEATEVTEPAEEEEAEGYPAVSFKKTAGNMIVSISAPEGALPEGATVKVVSVKAAEIKDAVEDMMENGRVVKAVDITFYDKEGKEIEPKKEVSVSFASEKFGDLNKPAVIHINDNGNAEKVEGAKVNTNTNKATFKSDEFSVYAVIDEGETGEDARLKVVFKNGDTTIATMYVKKSDTLNTDTLETVLYDPGAGTVPTGASFKGWTTKADYTADDVSNAKTIDGVRSDITAKFAATGEDAVKEGDTVIYYAMLFKQYTVNYLDENETSLGTDNIFIPTSSTESSVSYTVNMAYTPPDDLHNFEGWNVKSGGDKIEGYTAGKTYENETTISISGSVVFSVNSPEGHWLVFDENGKGGTYNAPAFYKSNEVTQKPRPDSEMVRAGYTFGGWYENPECTGNQFRFGNTLGENKTIYAKWTKNATANYTVIIWLQNLAGNGYDFKESITLTGTVDTTVNTVTQQGNGNNAYARVNGTNKQYTGFHLKEFDHNVTVATEGTSVVNIYYDRNEYTLTFQDHPYTVTTSGSGTQYALIDGRYVQLTRYGNNNYWYNGQRYYGTRYTQGSGWTTVKEIKALYQQNISENFPIVGNNGATYNHGERWDPQSNTPYNEVLVFIDVMPSSNVTFHLDVASHNTKTITYYIEALPNETPAITYNGKGFVVYKSVDANYNWFTEAEDYIDIVGFSKGGNTYPPRAYNANGTQLNSVWNNNNARNVQCFYTRDNFAINFMDGKYFDGDNPIADEVNRGQLKNETGHAYGSDLTSFNKGGDNYFEPTFGEYVFEGWYLDDACTQEYTFSTMPEGGITVYAKWRLEQYRVFLHPNAGTDATLNWGSSNTSLSFRVSSGNKVSAPTGTRTGYEFVGWYTDAACKNVFNAGAVVLNDSTVTTQYDRENEYTDTYDKWGNLVDPKRHADAERFWITKKLDLYGKWRATIDGANGIGVVYSPNGITGAGINPPEDNNLYLDNTQATAGAASTPSEANKVFKYWVVQKWNDATKTYDDTTTTVLPGNSFDVLKENAKCVVTKWVNPNNKNDIIEIDEDHLVPGITPPDNIHTKILNATYTVQLRAEYQEKGEATPTHIPWYKNDGTKAFHIDTVADGAATETSTLGINEAVTIQSAPTREGYTFLGWAKVNMGSSADAVSAFESESSNWTQSALNAGNLFLHYSGGEFHLNSSTGKVVSKVAADETTPYVAMFAVWQKDLKITVKKATKEYSGSEQKGYVENRSFSENGTGNVIDKEEYKIEGLANGDVLTVEKYTPSMGINVGIYTNGIFDGAASRIMRGNTDVTSTY